MDYFEKKQWIRIAVCTVLVAVGVLAMTGVFGGNGSLMYDPLAVNGVAVSSAQAAEQGFGGEVTARLALENGAIKTLTIDTPNETEGLGKRASEEAFTDQFIGKTGPFTFGEDGIEALSGATVTSNAALKAINKAIGAEEPAEEPAAEPAEEPAEEPAAEPAADGDALEAAEQGFGGDVTVHVTMDGDKIKALAIDTPNETAGLGQRASEAAFTDQFIGKNGPFTYGEDGIEALSGATVTSNAALKAINKAVGAEEAPAEEPAEEPAAEPAADGDALEAAEQGFGGDVTVHVTMDGDKIKTLAIDTPNETAGLGQRASEAAFTDQFIGKTGPFTYGEDGIEALTGATVTSTAALKAINKAVGAEEAPAEEPAEEPAAEPAEEPAAAPAAEEKPAEEATGNSLTSAAYRATAQNAFSTVTVTAAAKNGKLTDVKITSEGEEGKDLLTDAIREEWAKAILESGSASPDAITGATLQFSAASVQEAMTQILANMNGETAEASVEAPAEEAAPETEEKPAEETGNADNILSLIAVSMGKEKENSFVTDYLEQDPYLVNIYEGYGFAKDYGSARGHAYTLEDVQKTQRPHAKANCLTCKTPDMHKMIAEQGVSVYSMPFDEVMGKTTNTISCYTCHGADDGNGGKLTVTHQYVNEALGENVSEIKAASLSCGQCHIEYYFTPEDSEAMMPYHSKAEMTPEAILAYYDALGFADWEQPGTGTKMLKAQHPELETWAYGKHAAMLSCADCHMPQETTESGVQYHDHHVVSPLASETLLAKCAACHGSAESTIALVQGIQTKVTARETEVGNKLSALKDELTAAVSAGQMGEEELDAVRKLHREAQWFFDFCYVENSEGAHNSALAYNCLDTSETKIDEAMNLLASAGKSDVSAAAPENMTEEAPAEEVPAGEEKAAEEAPAVEETPKAPAAYAGYRVDKENAFSRITVIGYARNGKLANVKILSEGEDGKDLLTDEIRNNWAKAILESGSAAPDAITGATLQFSAGSVTEAMTEILDKINGK